MAIAAREFQNGKATDSSLLPYSVRIPSISQLNSICCKTLHGTCRSPLASSSNAGIKYRYLDSRSVLYRGDAFRSRSADAYSDF